MAIRFKVKDIAALRGFSQYKLAKVSGVDERTLRKIWRQDKGIVVNSDTLDKLATALQVDISDLLESDPPLPRLAQQS